ncbi:hypothetical protein CISG_04112 [Coccidioides immitis RMSCC 3703]|uniref:Uncharacterized protein n=2 Tax=Coccidioides immitis TaxID=5501 RepID=A0A0J8QR70_COCIT|nr:hypothetical protein CIRG_06629 [Coccidioides immitis RMSCC 2394]KMU75164.1 hypothetical protein CISG_04112 [Coccidioides immitis RMSCC 3703]
MRERMSGCPRGSGLEVVIVPPGCVVNLRGEITSSRKVMATVRRRSVNGAEKTSGGFREPNAVAPRRWGARHVFEAHLWRSEQLSSHIVPLQAIREAYAGFDRATYYVLAPIFRALASTNKVVFANKKF